MAKDCNFNTMHPFETKRVHFFIYKVIVSELILKANLSDDMLIPFYVSFFS